MNIRTLSIGLSAFVLLGIVCPCIGPRESIIDTILAPFAILGVCGFPPIVSMFFANRSTSPISQIILAGTSLLYGVWFAYLYYDAFYVNLDPQSGIIVFLAGIVALPVLLPLWTTAIFIEMLHRPKKPEP